MQKKNQSPPVIQKEMVTCSGMKQESFENGEDFCCFDSGDHGVDRILVFNTESGLDNLAKYRNGHVIEHLNVVQICTTNYSHYIEIAASLLYSFCFQGNLKRLNSSLAFYIVTNLHLILDLNFNDQL